VIDLLRTRRSVRRYKKGPIEEGSIEILKEALLRSFSGRGLNPWVLIFVDEPDLLTKLAQSKEDGSLFLKDAALAIVVCGDETKTDIWVENCSIASTIAHLTAHSLGLGSCWIGIRNRLHKGGTPAEDYVRALLGIPGHIRVESIISIGLPGETKAPVPGEKLDYGKIRYNRFA